MYHVRLSQSRNTTNFSLWTIITIIPGIYYLNIPNKPIRSLGRCIHNSIFRGSPKHRNPFRLSRTNTENMRSSESCLRSRSNSISVSFPRHWLRGSFSSSIFPFSGLSSSLTNKTHFVWLNAKTARFFPSTFLRDEKANRILNKTFLREISASRKWKFSLMQQV